VGQWRGHAIVDRQRFTVNKQRADRPHRKCMFLNWQLQMTTRSYAVV
jgi:hypothetical protein